MSGSDLQVHPSRWCQLRCRHCYTESGPDQRSALPGQLVEQAVRDAAGLGFGTLSVSGGEPLLYPTLDRSARCWPPGLVSGRRSRRTHSGLSARRVAELAPVTDLVAVSVDGTAASHDRMRGRRGAFDVMRSRLDLPRAARPRVRRGRRRRPAARCHPPEQGEHDRAGRAPRRRSRQSRLRSGGTESRQSGQDRRGGGGSGAEILVAAIPSGRRRSFASSATSPCAEPP